MIITKETRDNFVKILKYKDKQILEILEGRELENPKEGAGKERVWKKPENMIYIDSRELRLSIEYFKQELNSILETLNEGGL